MTFLQIEKDLNDFLLKLIKKQFKINIFLILVCTAVVIINIHFIPNQIISPWNGIAIGVNAATVFFVAMHMIFEAIEYKELTAKGIRLEELQLQRRTAMEYDLKNSLSESTSS